MSPRKKQLKQKIKILQQKLRRKNKKIKTLNDLITSMKEKNLLNSSPAELLKDQFSGLTLDMFESELKNTKRKAKGRCYNE